MLMLSKHYAVAWIQGVGPWQPKTSATLSKVIQTWWQTSSGVWNALSRLHMDEMVCLLKPVMPSFTVNYRKGCNMTL